MVAITGVMACSNEQNDAPLGESPIKLNALLPLIILRMGELAAENGKPRRFYQFTDQDSRSFLWT